MSYQNLRDFIAYLETKKDLKRISVPVDADLEITEIADRMVKKNGPALFFEKVKNSPYPVLINTFASLERMSAALLTDSLDKIAERMMALVPSSPPKTFWEKIGVLIKLKEIADFQPKKVKSGPCQEVIETSIDLDKLPVLKCWPGDSGRFITLPLVVTKNPNTGVQNLGMYRMQVFDKTTTGMHWHAHHDGAKYYREHQKLGKKMEVAAVLGGDPATIYSATAPLPPGLDELIFAGFLRKEPVEIVKAHTVDLYVPAQAEFILEGYVSLDELRDEGPFGDHTGYYSEQGKFPVFHVQCITRREKPIYPATIVGKPPMEDCYMGKATERIFLPLVRTQLPEIVDYSLPFEGVFHNCVIVSIKKEYPGQARKVASLLWGLGQMMFSKVIIIVDEEVNVQDYSEVTWKVFNNVDPERDVFFQKGPLDVLDHSSPTHKYGSKMGIDATRKMKEEGHPRPWPDEIIMEEKIKQLVTTRWKEYGF
ncbi:menaquinone biosynthesis decarboxylase [Candidatus Desantisbacteria bacterium]|nr:menaquinone biosynthesis decarboxylase [Candidatus Desantisbacteria bacterium]